MSIVNSPFAHQVNGKWFLSSHAVPQSQTMREYQVQVRGAYGNLRGVKFAELGVDYDHFELSLGELFPRRSEKTGTDLDLDLWAAAEYAIGRPFHFVPGQGVICNGHRGAVKDMQGNGLVEVRLASGQVCVSAAYPDVFPDPLDFVWRPVPGQDKLILFNRTGREFIALRRSKGKWLAETGETFRKRDEAMRAMEAWARNRIRTECDERASRSTALAN